MNATSPSSPAARDRALANHILAASTALGLGASVLLLIEYLKPDSGFCSTTSGCGLVAASKLAHIGGIPTPAFGVAFFGAVAVLSLLSAPVAHKLRALAGVGGALAGLGFFVYQIVVVHHLCKYCVMADASGLAVGALALLLRDGPAVAPRGQRATAGTLAFVALSFPFLVGWITRTTSTEAQKPIPASVKAQQQDGVVTIVEFADYTCPFCRLLHERMAPVVAKYPGKVRMVYFHIALPQHAEMHAVEAAKAGLCAEDQGKGDAMSDELFTADDLTEAGCEKLATKVGLDMAKYHACFADPKTKDRVDAVLQLARDQGIEKLPTYFIGLHQYDGVRESDILDGLIQDALKEAKIGS